MKAQKVYQSLETNSEVIKRYKHQTRVIRAIQRPCVFIATYCLSFLLFQLLPFFAKIPAAATIVLLVLGLLSLVVFVVISFLEKKLFRHCIAFLNARTEKAIKDVREDTK